MSADATPIAEDSSPLSKKGKSSLIALLFVQTQNAFNDNFVKFVLMGLAMAVAAEGFVGDNIEFILTAMIPVPFILLAPVAGFLSDRFSKSQVIWYCVIAQFVIFVIIALAIWMRILEVAVFGFFLLAIQSTLFSPAKQGILKEIVGSQKLGFANGLMSMLTMVGILGGMFAAGLAYDKLLKYFGETAANAWRAAFWPTLAISVGALIALAITRLIQKTPSHPDQKFSHSIWFLHFTHLKQLFREKALRNSALFITWYWFVANFLGLGFVAFAKMMNPNAVQAGRMTATSKMMAAIGVGLMIGSIIVSLLSKKKIRLPFTPIGGIGMAIGLVGVGLFDPVNATMLWYVSLGVVGFSSGFYVVPLNAQLQDLADENRRGRVIGALNLMTSFSGVVAIGLGLLLKFAGMTPPQQMLVFVIPTIIVSIVLQKSLRSLRPS